MSARQTSHEIDAEAAEWAARVDGGPLSPEEQAALDAWTAADPRRLGAYAKARAVFVHARRARALGKDFDPEEFANDDSVDADAAPVRRGRRKLLALSGVAVTVLTAGAAMMVVKGRLRAASRFVTARGEVRLFALPDSSTITLNTASVVEIEFDKARRLVKLISGEALFDVVKDAARPFVVEAGDTLVQAIGTSFTVRRLEDHPVEVLVRQGVVEVMRHAAQTTRPIRVEANMRAATAGASAIEAVPIAAAQISRELAWREGMLSFEDVRLDQAAAEFARYSDTRIVIDDPEVAAQTVTGLFSANNPAGFAKAVAAMRGLRADASPGEVTLRR